MDSSVEENSKDILRNNTNQEEEDKEVDDDDDNANSLARSFIEKSNLRHTDHLLSDDSTISHTNDIPIDLNHGPVDPTDAKGGLTVDLTQATPKKVDVIEMTGGGRGSRISWASLGYEREYAECVESDCNFVSSFVYKKKWII